MRNNCIVIFHVDDCCIFSKNKDTIDALLKNQSKIFKMTNEGGVRSYPGINVIRDPNVTITKRQPANIKKILNRLGICDESKMHDTQTNFILTIYEDGNGREQDWRYPSVIGQMKNLSETTGPDIFILFFYVQSTS